MISADEIDKMRMFILLFCLTAGCRADAKGKGCRGGEMKYLCEVEKCTPADETQQSIVSPLKVTYKNPEAEQNRKNQPPEMKHVEFEVDNDCPEGFLHTAYEAGRTIACNFTHSRASHVWFFCKVSHSKCITRSDVSLTVTNRGYNVIIDQVKKEHAGVYWCGLKETVRSSRADQRHSAFLKKIKLSVKEVTKFQRNRTVGQDFSYFCKYSKYRDAHPKFICKGDDPDACQPVVNSSTPENGRFSMRDNYSDENITVTIKELRVTDGGSYWCGAQISDGNVFIHKLSLTIERPQSPTSASPVTLTTEPSVESRSVGPQLQLTVIVCVVVLLLLLFVTVLSLAYKRCSASKNSAAQNTKEDYTYEEIHVSPPKPDSGNATNTIYATANFPTMQPASLHYASINIKRHPDGGADDSQFSKQESCQYTAVKYRQSEASS